MTEPGSDASCAPREPGDRWEPFEVDRFTQRVGAEAARRLGPGTLVASARQRHAGAVGRLHDRRDRYWLQADAAQAAPLAASTWLIWVGIALLATLLGSVAIARLINQPLRELSFAASRIRDGDFDSRLDENTLTSEIREVNIGFNRMARELAKVEEDRAVMLAGISHDLRTPLARLRLETEMSVHDEEAQRNMAPDIDQLDAIIDKFMDYARPGEIKLGAGALARAGRPRDRGFPRPARRSASSRGVPPTTAVMADETELGRVLLNLFENARRYGRTADDRHRRRRRLSDARPAAG